MFKNIRNLIATFIYVGDDNIIIEFEKLKKQNARYKNLLIIISRNVWEIDSKISDRLNEDLPKSISMETIKV